MPFVSQAQRAKFHADPKLRKYVSEMEAATPKGKKLPKHVKPKKRKKGPKLAKLSAAAAARRKRALELAAKHKGKKR